MSYSFRSLNNSYWNANHFLSINNSGTIAGYGSGTPTAKLHSDGYTVSVSFNTENYPNSQDSWTTGINSFGRTVGYWGDSQHDNFGFVNNGGTSTNVADPNTPVTTPHVNQLLGI